MSRILCRLLGHSMRTRFFGPDGPGAATCQRCAYDDVLDPLLAGLADKGGKRENPNNAALP